MPKTDTHYVQLVASKEAVAELKRILQGSDFEIVNRNGSTLMTHPILQSTKNVAETGRELATMIRGVYRLATGSSPELDVQCSYYFDKEGKAKTSMTCTETVKFSDSVAVRIVDRDGNERVILPTDPIPAWLSKALSELAALKAVRLFETQGNTWFGLYKVYEAIREVAGDPAALDVVSKKELRRFTQTANSFEALGDEARHATPGVAPTKPMTFGEARNIVASLLTAYLGRE